METLLNQKSTIAEIRRRFDNDVERFSNLETGQSATIDAPLTMDLISRAALAHNPKARRFLDIGCGAGNYTIKLLQIKSDCDCDLVDLSKAMLNRAHQRVTAFTTGKIQLYQGDFREIELPKNHYDVVVAAAVFHHLRDERDWEVAFCKIYEVTALGGSFWISDLVSHESLAIQEMMWEIYGDYLTSLGGADYRKKVFDYIDREDSPRSVTFQMELLKKVGFQNIEILHKNGSFAAFGGVKAAFSKNNL